MNDKLKWALIIGGGIVGVLILIGLVGILIKFFLKRFRKRAWNDINSLPKNLDTSENTANRRAPKRRPSERELLYPSTTTTNNNTLEVSDGHIAIPIDENDYPAHQHHGEHNKQPEHTLVQIQRDRLNRLKEEENRLRPMVHLPNDDEDIRRAIEQAQKEFEESVANASAKVKRRQGN